MLTAPALTLRFRSRYPAHPRSVRVIRGVVDEVARDCGACEAALDSLRQAVSEAARDAASNGLPGSHVYVSVELGDGELVVSICDEADTDVRVSFACALAVDQEHDSAVERLEAAVAEAGTSAEADAHVAARQAWVHWVDDEAYRGLNAGPFELRQLG